MAWSDIAVLNFINYTNLTLSGKGRCKWILSAPIRNKTRVKLIYCTENLVCIFWTTNTLIILPLSFSPVGFHLYYLYFTIKMTWIIIKCKCRIIRMLIYISHHFYFSVCYLYMNRIANNLETLFHIYTHTYILF